MPWTSFMVTLNKNCRVRLATLFSDTDSNKVRIFSDTDSNKVCMYEYLIRVLPIWWRIMMSIKNAVQLNSTWAVWLVWTDHISVQALIVSIDSSDYEKYINRAIPQELTPEYQPIINNIQLLLSITSTVFHRYLSTWPTLRTIKQRDCKFNMNFALMK